jgi:hypothetical protein
VAEKAGKTSNRIDHWDVQGRFCLLLLFSFYVIEEAELKNYLKGDMGAVEVVADLDDGGKRIEIWFDNHYLELVGETLGDVDGRGEYHCIVVGGDEGQTLVFVPSFGRIVDSRRSD